MIFQQAGTEGAPSHAMRLELSKGLGRSRSSEKRGFVNEKDIFIEGISDGDPGPAGVGVIIKDPCGQILSTINQYLGVTTEDIARYRALIAALEEARRLSLRGIKVYTVSNVLQGQVLSEHPLMVPRIVPLHRLVRKLMESFECCEVVRIPSDRNQDAKKLANEGVENCQVIQFPAERLNQASG